MNPRNALTLTPPKINLATSEDIRRELAKVYREARGGTLPIGDGTKLCFMLVQLLKAHEMSVLEMRVEALEQAA